MMAEVDSGVLGEDSQIECHVMNDFGSWDAVFVASSIIGGLLPVYLMCLVIWR
jgi:hypothetical protein